MRRREGGPWRGLRRILRLTGRHTVGEELDDELRFHLEGRVEELVAGGLPREEAEAEALRRFGDVARVKEACARVEGRMRARRARLEALLGLLDELRHGWRALRQRPGFTLIMVLTLALGIGANTAIFSAVRAVLLRPLPLEGLERVVVVQSHLPGQNQLRAGIAVTEALDLSGLREVFEAVGAYEPGASTLTGHGQARKLAAAWTAGDFFGALGVRPHLGRLYGPEDLQSGRPRVVVLSHALWRELSGGDPSLVGRTLVLDGAPHEVVGVLPPHARFPRDAQLFGPLLAPPWGDRPEDRGIRYATAVARVRPGVTPEQLASALAREAERWHAEYGPSVYPAELGHSLLTQPFREWLAGELRPVLLVLLGAVAFVLLIACANVAGLQLVRTVTRARELAVRAALGAGAWSLMRQLLAESLLLAAAGGVAGLGLGALLVSALQGTDPVLYPQLQELALDRTVLGFTAGLTLLVALLAGTAPALRAAQVSPGDALKEGGAAATAGVGRARLLQAGVVVQVALALLLLLGAGLTSRSLARLLQTDPGFRPAQVLSLRVRLPERAQGKHIRHVTFFSEVLERLQALPGVEGAGLISDVPFSARREGFPFFLPGQLEAPAGSEQGHADGRIVSAGYFRTLGIPLVRGRLFDDTEPLEGGRVAVVDAQLARQYFPGEDPVGKQLGFLRERATIIGVVGDVQHGALGEPPRATIYVSHRQFSLWELSVVLRSPLPPEQLAAGARAAMAELAPDVPLYQVAPLEQLVHRSLGARWLAVAVLGAFAGVSLLLALLGIYGVVSYRARQRTREVGIRLALGARPADVSRLVLRGGVALALWGVGAGLLLFAALGRSLAAAFPGLEPLDAPVLLLAALLVGLVALVASWLPARRAARVDPLGALRAE